MSMLNKVVKNEVTADLMQYKQLIAGRPKAGKAITNDTLIPTPEGFKCVDEIKEGDVLFDRLGRETKVLGVFPQGELEVYEVTLDDGRKFYANDEHIVPYITSRGNISSKTIKEMLEDFKYKKESGFEGRGEITRYKYSVPNNKAVDYPEKELPIDPYALGVLIGDGSLTVKYLTISSNEFDVVDKTSKKLGLGTPEKSNHNYGWTFKAEEGKREDVTNKIVELGLNVKSIERFIPREYQTASPKQRKNLLQGLMDTDGNVRISDKGAVRFDFSTNSEQLAKDVKLLSHSLGYGATLSVNDRKNKDNIEYIVHIYTKDKRIVTSEKHTSILEEKAKTFSHKENRAKIVDIKKLDKKEPMTCFTVDNAEELFLINDYIVTHNTSLFHGIVKQKFEGDMSKGLLVAFEKGYSALDGIHAVDIEEWEDFQDLVEELVDNKDEVSYQVLGFDTIDILIKLATQYVVAKQSIADKKRYTAINDIGWGKGYELLENEISEQVGKLDQAGYSLFFITHDKDTTMTTREGLEYNKTIISAGGRGGNYFRNTADLIVFIELTKEVEKGKQVDKRYIYFRGDADMEAGSRFKHAPTRVEYSTENYINAIEDAIKKEYGSDEAVEEAKEKQAKEAVKVEKEKKKEESIKPEDLIAEIDKKLKDVSKDDKLRLAELLKADFGNANYKKYDDVDDLKKALKLVGKL